MGQAQSLYIIQITKTCGYLLVKFVARDIEQLQCLESTQQGWNLTEKLVI